MTEDLTPRFVFAVRRNQTTVAGAIRACARFLASRDREGYVDSYALAAELPEHELTYLQFVLRETRHICRHTIGEGRYAFHPEPVCSAACDEKHVYTAPDLGAGTFLCGCGIRNPVAVPECDFCGQERAA